MRFSNFTRIIWLNLAVLLLLAAGLLAGHFVPAGPFLHGPGIFNQIFTWDARWYLDIAQHGYHWDPQTGGQWGHNQNVAFFPLFPLIEWVVLKITGSVSVLPLILLAVGFGLWSNFVFARLASVLLPDGPAFWATVFFALWPAACFLAMGYPAGLINLCAIQCLWNYVEKRRLKAVLWCGLGTAAAPGMVFIAAALCVDLAINWLRSRKAENIPTILMLCLISVWGLIGYMIYLQVMFHDAFAFMAAQGGYATTPPPATHLLRFINVFWYLQPLIFAWHVLGDTLWHGLAATAAGRQRMNVALQEMLDFLAAGLTLLGLIKSRKYLRHSIIAWAGWCTFLGFVWFIASTDLNLTCAVRLLYPALPLFFALGIWADQHIALRYAALLSAGVLLVAEVALAAAGYGVI